LLRYPLDTLKASPIGGAFLFPACVTKFNFPGRNRVENKKQGNKKGTQKTPESLMLSMVAGTGFEPVTFGL
jgi:hypothetical protein